MKIITIQQLINELKEPIPTLNSREEPTCESCGAGLSDGWEDNGMCERCN